MIFSPLKKYWKKKLLGDVHEFEAHYDRYRAEERLMPGEKRHYRGSGILYDLGAHIIDQVLYFFGMPLNITADIRLQGHMQG